MANVSAFKELSALGELSELHTRALDAAKKITRDYLDCLANVPDLVELHSRARAEIDIAGAYLATLTETWKAQLQLTIAANEAFREYISRR